MLMRIFKDSPYLAMNATYPGKYKPWQFAYVPNSYWTKETGIKATKWLIEEKLKWSEEELFKGLSIKVFRKYGLSGMIHHVYNNSPYSAINSAYPDKYKPWQFPNVPLSYWNNETAAEATKWLIEEKLKWSEDTLLENLSARIFIKNGLSGMLHAVFANSPYAAINNAYPGKYVKSDFYGYRNKV